MKKFIFFALIFLIYSFANAEQIIKKSDFLPKSEFGKKARSSLENYLSDEVPHTIFKLWRTRLHVESPQRSYFLIGALTAGIPKNELVYGTCDLYELSANSTEIKRLDTSIENGIGKDSYDFCLGFKSVSTLDVNADGLQDIVYEIALTGPDDNPYKAFFVLIQSQSGAFNFSKDLSASLSKGARQSGIETKKFLGRITRHGSQK